MWAVMTEEVVIPVEAIYDANNAHVLTEGLLTLVELSHLARFLVFKLPTGCWS